MSAHGLSILTKNSDRRVQPVFSVQVAAPVPESELQIALLSQNNDLKETKKHLSNLQGAQVLELSVEKWSQSGPKGLWRDITSGRPQRMTQATTARPSGEPKEYLLATAQSFGLESRTECTVDCTISFVALKRHCLVIVAIGEVGLLRVSEYM
ncbi:hypothetical protein PROFUN_16242 [Planoprotostelium fungivorum]|uniref:Uncharacterized protein n=1 Tax=Planoprotostelium fungivorum TaxID=1890364 RepID=A0A2P6MRC8_9EUKA|nr:hypothetical protein PROFUN_16242 [Planoprotostelium fungivorum]